LTNLHKIKESEVVAYVKAIEELFFEVFLTFDFFHLLKIDSKECDEQILEYLILFLLGIFIESI
jgi:hypothetical protein